MVDVHTLEILPTVEELNEAVGRAFLARLRTLINEAGAGSRVDLAISGGAITTSLLPSLLPFVGEVDWSRVRVWLVDERYVASGDEDRNDDQAWEGFFRAAAGVEFVRMPTSDASAPGAGSLDEATADDGGIREGRCPRTSLRRRFATRHSRRGHSDPHDARLPRRGCRRGY